MLDEGEGLPNARMTGHLGGVTPRQQVLWDEQAVSRSTLGDRDISQSLLDLLFHHPVGSPYHADRRDDAFGLIILQGRGKLAGQGVRLDILIARAVGKGIAKAVRMKAHWAWQEFGPWAE